MKFRSDQDAVSAFLIGWVIGFAVLVAALVFLAGRAQAQTPVSEVLSAALVGPFDQTANHQSFITVHSPGAVSPQTGLPQVIAHWTFWSDSCVHLANFSTCLTKDDSIVIDPSNMGGVDAENQQLDSRVDVTGFRGMFTVHAFEADERCRDPADLGFSLVDKALHGTWSIANTETNAAFGDRTQSLNPGILEPGIVVPSERFDALDIPFFQPDSLEASELILLTVVEGFGDLPGEIGPPQGRVIVDARARTFDVQELGISLPDVSVGCALFTSLIPGPGTIIPDTVMPASSGFLRLSSPRFSGDMAVIVGNRVWIYGWHGQQLGPYGTGARATYLDPIEFATPTPAPTAAPPTGTPGVTPTLPLVTPTPGATPTPDGSPTPGATPTNGVSPTPTVSPVETPSPTPTSNQASPTPSASPTPTSGAPTGTPGPTATPETTPTVSPTPVSTATPLPTPTDVFGP